MESGIRGEGGRETFIIYSLVQYSPAASILLE